MAVTIEVYRQADQWHVRREGESEPLSSHATKDAATVAGRDAARSESAELVIKNADGTIAQKDSHGHDPRNVPG